jgi:hypothetical protein
MRCDGDGILVAETADERPNERLSAAGLGQGHDYEQPRLSRH